MSVNNADATTDPKGPLRDPLQVRLLAPSETAALLTEGTVADEPKDRGPIAAQTTDQAETVDSLSVVLSGHLSSSAPRLTARCQNALMPEQSTPAYDDFLNEAIPPLGVAASARNLLGRPAFTATRCLHLSQTDNPAA